MAYSDRPRDEAARAAFSGARDDAVPWYRRSSGVLRCHDPRGAISVGITAALDDVAGVVVLAVRHTGGD